MNDTAIKRILILEDSPMRIRAFRSSGVFEGFVVDYAETAESAIRLLKSNSYRQAFLDHDLGGEIYVDSSNENTGAGVCRWMSANATKERKETGVIIHSHNPTGASTMERTLTDAGYQSVRKVPFSYLKSSTLDVSV